MTEEQRKKTAFALFKQLEKPMSYLYSRWLDECKYENIDDYATQLKEAVKNIDGMFLAMSKRPFGFTYKLAEATYKVWMSGRAYQYRRIG